MYDQDSNSVNSSFTDSPLDEQRLKSYFEDIVISLTHLTNDKFKELETKIESIEKQIATLVIGFGEQAVFLEALLAQLSFATEEEQKTFQQNVATARREMLKVMQDGSKTLVADENEHLASAIEDVVESKLFDS
jgi:hypothetical protein